MTQPLGRSLPDPVLPMPYPQSLPPLTKHPQQWIAHHRSDAWPRSLLTRSGGRLRTQREGPVAGAKSGHPHE